MRPFAQAALATVAGVVGLVPGPIAADTAALAAEFRAATAVLLAVDENPGVSPSRAVATLLGAVSRLAREAGVPQPLGSQIDAAAARVGGDQLPDDRVLEELRSACAALNGGRSFEIPPTARGIEATKEIARRQADRAVAALTAGRRQEAAREILGFVVLVATPMDASF